ncbi:hypothetical protein V6N11_036281 [Hibiscus sabdariffa]|uniref:Uncharacterized protein n=1 Tax=Hibiscus sabdariffa TaxID=183260 RepID=A0ABR2R9X6_9ROSI
MPDRSLLYAFDAFPAYDISLLAPCFSKAFAWEILGEDQGGIRDLDQTAIRSDLKRKDQSYGSDLASSYKQPPPRQASKGHMRAQRTSKRALDLTTGAMEQVVLV